MTRLERVINEAESLLCEACDMCENCESCEVSTLCDFVHKFFNEGLEGLERWLKEGEK